MKFLYFVEHDLHKAVCLQTLQSFCSLVGLRTTSSSLEQCFRLSSAAIFSFFILALQGLHQVPLVKCQAILMLTAAGTYLCHWVPLPASAGPEVLIILQSVDPVVAPRLQPHALICGLLLGPSNFTFPLYRKLIKTINVSCNSHRCYESLLPWSCRAFTALIILP